MKNLVTHQFLTFCGFPTLIFLQYVQIGIYHMIMATGHSFLLSIFSEKSQSTRLLPMPRCALIHMVTFYTWSYLNFQPYPRFNPDKLQDYVFVPLPLLQ